MGYYEIILIYGKDCADVITFECKGILTDENDIVSQAIRMGFLGKENRKHVRWARSISRFEYVYGRKAYEQEYCCEIY